jgi:tricorn protease
VTNQGYYRYPAVHGNEIVFTAQGDLWSVPLQGGSAHSLTSHPGEESNAAISPDGKRVAFSAQYEGPTEVYVMPLEGGQPTRLTYAGEGCTVIGWSPDGNVLYATYGHSTLPDMQLFTVNPATRTRKPIPLRQASDGCYSPDGHTLYFVRLPFQGSHTKRYKGGTAQQLWKYTDGANEAVPLTTSFEGTSKNPMWWDGRVYYITDHDGSMNLWSMKTDGTGQKQLTHHHEWDVQSASLDSGKIVYQLGPDLYTYDIATGTDRVIPITLTSDLDQTREHWIKNPVQFVSGGNVSPDGSHVVLTARGRVFVASVKPGRLVEVTHKEGVRYRNARFTSDGKSVLTLSDETGETEWWKLPANGLGDATRITSDARVFRTDGIPSPDGKWLAYTDKNQEIWLLNLETKAAHRIDSSIDGEFGDVAWASDSKWLSYVKPFETFGRIMVYSVDSDKATPVTSERSDSYSPAWSADGHWLYFLSDRNFSTPVNSPWGPRQPEPYFPKQTKIYALSLQTGLRSPFQPTDELQPAEPAKPATPSKTVEVALDGIANRVFDVPAPAGNYRALTAPAGRLIFLSWDNGQPTNLMTLEVTNVEPSVKQLAGGVSEYQLSQDGKHLWIRKGNSMYVVDAGGSVSLDKPVDLSGWTFSVQPVDEWRHMVEEAWRLERDYFYDKNMHGVDWNGVLKQYLPVAERVRDRNELNDLIGQMVSELSALHTFVVGGERRPGTDSVYPASLGAEWSPAPDHSGYRIDRIYHGDPDYPDQVAPVARPGVDIAEGDIIQSINGIGVFDVPDPSLLLRSQEGKQVLVHVKNGKTGAVRDTIVTPMSVGDCSDLRYADWEISRRKIVDEKSANDIGYVHLRAMGSGDIEQWAREFYPVFNRNGLIIDVRHNGGGNIDSWILEKLLRKAWMYWQPRIGRQSWNMQYAFRGKVVVLCDEDTASDGEAFTEGFRRLGLGKVIGTRTWGGEIWLSFDTWLVDNGIASAAETGVYGPEGKWLIEGHGVDPDMVVDDPPHAAYLGADAQLDAAIDYLQREIKAHPNPPVPHPIYPIKALTPPKK